MRLSRLYFFLVCLSLLILPAIPLFSSCHDGMDNDLDAHDSNVCPNCAASTLACVMDSQELVSFSEPSLLWQMHHVDNQAFSLTLHSRIHARAPPRS